MKRLTSSRPLPHQLDVACPVCRRLAEFEFAEVVRIKLKSDVEFFQNSKLLEYQNFHDSCGHIWHGAIYFQGLHGEPTRAIPELPNGYAAENWNHPKSLRNSRGWRVGSVRCSHCHLRCKHTLAWPDDAYFSIEYRRHVLWAYHRESAVELVQYLASTERHLLQYRWMGLLMYVPAVFKARKARESVVKKMWELIR